jgi:hypothetical protein
LVGLESGTGTRARPHLFHLAPNKLYCNKHAALAFLAATTHSSNIGFPT